MRRSVKESHIKKEIFYKERDEDERKGFKEELSEIPEGTDVVHIDESGVRKDMNPTYGRSESGVKIHRETGGKRTKKDNVTAGYCNGLIFALRIFARTTDTEWFCFWSEHTLIPLLKPNSVIVMDNAGFHSKTYLPVIAEAYGHRILRLSEYSPDMNPVEHVRADMKRWLHNFSENYSDIRSALPHHFQ